jgi:hypothetical protein
LGTQREKENVVYGHALVEGQEENTRQLATTKNTNNKSKHTIPSQSIRDFLT